MMLRHGFRSSLLVDGSTVSQDEMGTVVVGHVKFERGRNFREEFLRVDHTVRYNNVRDDLVISERASRNIYSVRT